jgi:mannose-6-phosphate isomerase
LTYRIYDYGRVDAQGKSRELHVEKALEVIDFNAKTNAKVATHPHFIRGKKIWEDLVDCRYFSTMKFETEERIHMTGHNPSEQFSLWVFLEGEGTIGWSSARHGMFGSSYSGEFNYKLGECWFIPAEFASRGYYPKSKTNLLIAAPRNSKHDLEKHGNAD